MKRKKGIFVNGEWLGGLVVIDELFRTICNISPSIIKEFVQTINEINQTEEEVKINNFQYQNQNSMVIEFGNDNLAGNVQLQFESTDEGFKVINKNVNIYKNTASDSNGEHPVNHNMQGYSGGYYPNNNAGYPNANMPPNYQNSSYPQNYNNYPPNSNMPNYGNQQSAFYPQNFNGEQYPQGNFGMNPDMNPNGEYNQQYPNYNNGTEGFNNNYFPNYGNNPEQQYGPMYPNNGYNAGGYYNPDNPDMPYYPQDLPYNPNYPSTYPNYMNNPHNPSNMHYDQGVYNNTQGFPQNDFLEHQNQQNNTFRGPNGMNNIPQNENYQINQNENYINNPNVPNQQRGYNGNVQPNNNGPADNRQSFVQNNNGAFNVNNRNSTFNNNGKTAGNKGFNNQSANFNNGSNINLNRGSSPNNFSGDIRHNNSGEISGIDYSGILSYDDKTIMETLNANIEKLNEKLDKFNPEIFEKIAQNINSNGGLNSNNFGENINNNTIVNNQFGGFPMGGFPGMVDPEIIQQFFQSMMDPNSRLSKFYKGYMFPGAEEDNEPEPKLMTLSEYLDAEKIAMLKKKKKKRSFNIMSSKGKRDNVNELEDGYFIGGKKIYKWGEPVQLDS